MMIFTDPNCFGNSHLTFNKRILEDLNLDNNLVWIGDKKYGKSLFEEKAVLLKSWNYKKEYSFKIGLLRNLLIFAQILKNKSREVVFLSVENVFFPLFFALFSPLLIRKRFKIIIHNNMNTILNSKIRLLLFKLIHKLGNLEFVVLTMEMKDKWDEFFPKKSVLIRHPMFRKTIDFASLNKNNFLVLGRQSKIWIDQNGLQRFVEAFENTRFTDIELTIFGEPVKDFTHNDSIKVNWIKNYLSETEYEQCFQNSNFVIFPLDNVNRYRASGILIDTLSRGKIFIAPNIGHFKEFKDCGLFYDENNFEEILRQAFLLSNEEVKRFKRNILNEIEKINSQNLNEILFSKF